MRTHRQVNIAERLILNPVNTKKKSSVILINRMLGSGCWILGEFGRWVKNSDPVENAHWNWGTASLSLQSAIFMQAAILTFNLCATM